MGSAPVTKEGMIQLRGIMFAVENIQAAMLEIGGKPVSDAALNAKLDAVMIEHIRTKGIQPNALAVEAVPDVWFIPKEINLHNFPGSKGIPSGGWIYFAVEKKLMFHA